MVFAELSVYPPRGNYQLIVRKLQPIGIGALLQKLEELKAKLGRLGYFDADKKKPIPGFPKRIGIVTSPTGAAVRDMLQILDRRYSGYHVILNPVKVQGEGAAREIAQAIDEMNHHQLADVLIVGRGGGSIEDLWAFNEELVATAIFKSRIPVISAVGHETDTCLSDWVADLRAPTPSAAAELVSQERSEKLKQLQGYQRHLDHHMRTRLDHFKMRLLAAMNHPFLANSTHLLGLRYQKLDDLTAKLDDRMHSKLQSYRFKLQSFGIKKNALNPIRQITEFKRRSSELGSLIDQAMERRIRFSLEKLSHLVQTMQSIDPKNLLKKGYSILFAEKERSVITSISELHEQLAVRILLQDGEVSATLNNIGGDGGDPV